MKKLKTILFTALLSCVLPTLALAQSVPMQPLFIPASKISNMVMLCVTNARAPGKCDVARPLEPEKLVPVEAWLKLNGLKTTVAQAGAVLLPNGVMYLAIEVER